MSSIPDETLPNEQRNNSLSDTQLINDPLRSNMSSPQSSVTYSPVQDRHKTKPKSILKETATPPLGEGSPNDLSRTSLSNKGSSPTQAVSSPRPSAKEIYFARQNSKKGSPMATSPAQNIPGAARPPRGARPVDVHSPHSLPKSGHESPDEQGMSYGALDSKDPRFMAIQARILAKQRLRTESQRSVVSTTAVENGKVSAKPSLMSMIGVMFGSNAGSRYGSSKFGQSNSRLSSGSGSTSRVNYVTEATSIIPSFSSAFSIEQFVVPNSTRQWLEQNEADLAEPGKVSSSVAGNLGNIDSFDDPDYTDTVRSTDSAGSLLRRSLSVPNEYISRPRSSKRHVAEIFEDFFQHNQSDEQLDSSEDIHGSVFGGPPPPGTAAQQLKWRQMMDDLIECPEYVDSLESQSSKTGLLAKHAKELATAPLKPPLTPTDEMQEIEFEKAQQIEKFQCMKNLFVLSISFAFLFAAYLSLRNLASSLYHEQGLGMYALSTVYASVCTGCIFATTIVQRLRPKRTMILCFSGILVYIAANFYPTFFTIIPGAMLVGLSLSSMWTAHATYLTNIAVTYSECTGMKLGESLGKFNGIFFLFFQISQVVGGVASSLVLMKSQTHHQPGESNETYFEMENISDHGLADYGHCGANYCHISSVDSVSMDIDRNTHYMLIGIYAVLACVGLLILCVFLDKLEGPMKKSQKNIQTQLTACFKFFYDKRVLMLLGMMFYSLLQVSFMFGEFTKAFVTCTLGMHIVGFAMVCMSACAAVSSYMCGKLQPYVGRTGLFLAAGTINLTLMLAMLFWEPTESTIYVIFILAGLWGIGDGVYITQVVSLFGLLFAANKEPAFAALKMCQAMGAFTIFVTGPYLCTKVKIYIVLAALVIAMGGYLLLEFQLNKKNEENVKHNVLSTRILTVKKQPKGLAPV